MKPPAQATVARIGVEGVHEKGTSNFRSLDGLNWTYYVDQVTKGEGKEHYCLTFSSKLKPAFQRLEELEDDTIFFLCDAEKGRFETYILATEIRRALTSQQTTLTLPDSTPIEAARFSKQCGYPVRPAPCTNGSNTAHVKVPVDFLEKWKLTTPPADEANQFDDEMDELV